jgi:hypothetical protein
LTVVISFTVVNKEGIEVESMEISLPIKEKEGV